MVRIVIGNNMGRQSHIIDEHTTLRTALEEAGIDYSTGMTSLDGCTLAPGDLDKTFADFGITEKAFLMNVVKADNAATARIVGQAFVIESAFTLEEIARLEKYNPDALVLTKGEGDKKEEVFRVGTTKGAGSIGKYGASFGQKSASTGNAVITMMVPEDVEDAKAWAVEKVGSGILLLKTVEDTLGEALSNVDAQQALIEDAIEVI